MNTHLTTTKYFNLSAGLILAVTGIAKLTVIAIDSKPIFEMKDPIFGLPFRALMLLAGAIELIVAAVCIFRCSRPVGLWLTALLATCFATYRLGMIWVGYHGYCPCFGTLTEVLNITPNVANAYMVSLLVYLFVGSVALLVTGRRKMERLSPTMLRMVATMLAIGALSAKAEAQGFALQGVFVQKINEQETNGVFSIEVDGNRYHMTVGPVGGTSYGDVELGSDGADVYEIVGNESLNTPSGVITKGTVTPGVIPSSEIMGNPPISQILWLAYASSANIAQDGTEGARLLPALMFSNEHWVDWPGIRTEAEMSKGPFPLPADIRFHTSAYLIIKKSDIPANFDLAKAGVKPALVPGEYRAPYAPPFVGGYKMAQMISTDFVMAGGCSIPKEVNFMRFVTRQGAKSKDDLQVINSFRITVTKIGPLVGELNFLPKLKSQSVVQDYRFKSVGGTRVLYGVASGRWVLGGSAQFKSMLEAYQNRAKHAAESNTGFKRTIMIAVILLLPALLAGRWWLTRNKNQKHT